MAALASRCGEPLGYSRPQMLGHLEFTFSPAIYVLQFDQSLIEETTEDICDYRRR